jgi:hypothetical protein
LLEPAGLAASGCSFIASRYPLAMHDERLAFRRTVAAIGGWALALLAV